MKKSELHAGDGIVQGYLFKGMVNCQNSRDEGPPECNSARG